MKIRLPVCLGFFLAFTGVLFATGAITEPPAGTAAVTTQPAVTGTVESADAPTNVLAATELVVMPPAVDNGLVTLNVDDTLISQIMNAFSRQTGRSIVVGPDVTGRTTVRLTGVPWESALDAVLKPFGYGHYNTGNATVVCGTDAVVPRVFELKYLDAADVEDLVRSSLSPRGKFSKVLVRSQSWSASTEGGGTSLAGGNTMGKRQRSQENKEVARTKTILITDISSSLDQIALLLDKVDRLPPQILIEARFMEANPSVLRDIGVEFGTGANGATAVGYSQGGAAYSVLGQDMSGTVRPANFLPASGSSLQGSEPFNAGLNLALQKLSDPQFQLLLHMLQENTSVNVLSAPRILTLNNQEATIIVGTMYPIIDANASGGNGTVATITTSLRGYEDIGIQLNVLPQVCEGNSVSMIVRPSVRELIGNQSGVSVSGTQSASTEYPIISTREAETQVLLRNGQTIVIGGLLKDKQTRTTIKVPILGDIPLLGALFRRQTDQSEKIDLLIFLTASIVTEGSSLMQTNLASQIAGPFGVPATVSTTGTPFVTTAVLTAPVTLSVAPIASAPQTTVTSAVAKAEAAAAMSPVVAEPAAVTPSAPVVPAAEMAALVTPAAFVPVPAVAGTVPAAPAVVVPDAPVPTVAPAVAAANDEITQAVERARAASAQAADTAGTIRKGWGMP